MRAGRRGRCAGLSKHPLAREQGETKEANEGFLGARLVRDLRNPNSFVSFAAWGDLDSMRAWQGSSEFGKRFDVVHALCEDMRSGGYELVVDI
ncbi:quinol monooxygenase YgiN [Streptomyces sp. V4I8]|uniref:antibiotic biosynthesis monooxygenase family protein n=1 Tax=Streptomyces sp. V4I8 TaxID=3156469 RepID=UPI003514F250